MFNKIEKCLFYLFLFSIPFQTRKILWYEGWRFNEWQSMSIYFTDILIIILLLFCTCNSFFSSTSKLKIKKEKFKTTIKNLKVYEYFLLIFLIVSAISIKNSTSPIISWFQWAKLVEFVLFYFYLKNYAFWHFDLLYSAYAFIAGGLFQAVIGITQFLKQSSLGLWYLGESMIGVDIRGTAYFLNLAGEKVVRAYGTTPHPNVLAGYLLLVLFAWYFLNSRLIKDYKLQTATYLSYSLLLFSFFLTFSRVVILAWVVAFIIGTLIYRKSYPKEIKKIFMWTCMIVGIFTLLYWPEILARLAIPAYDEGLILRKQYAESVLKSDLHFFGIGIGNFVSWFTERNPMEAFWLYQPVHNIYLLIYSETGLFGISAFILFIFLLIRNCLGQLEIRSIRLIFLACFIFIGLFDHFLWTLQQGRLVFWGVLTLLSFGDIMQLPSKKGEGNNYGEDQARGSGSEGPS